MMRSPKGDHELRQLEGNPADLWTRGDGWVKLGTAMKSTATELKSIGDSSVNKSMGTDKFAEMASDTSGDLEDAGVRYHDTGEVIRTYANALDVAKGWLSRNMDDIIAAEKAYDAAVSAKEDAVDKKDDLDTTMPWEDDPTDQDKTAAQTAVSNASSTLTSAEASRDALWESFDQVFGTWSEAYDHAVDGIQKAMDTAGNDDGFWEALGDFLDVIGWVLIVLTVIALIIGAPLFGVLGLIILGLSAFVFLAKLATAIWGGGSWSDVVFAAISLIPFGVGKLLGSSARLAPVVSEGRTLATAAIRSDLPAVMITRPSTWLTPVRYLAAPAEALFKLPKPGLLVNPFRSILLGGPEAKIATFLKTVQGSTWAGEPGVAAFITRTAGELPGWVKQSINLSVFAPTFGLDVADSTGIRDPLLGIGDYDLEWSG